MSQREVPVHTRRLGYSHIGWLGIDDLLREDRLSSTGHDQEVVVFLVVELG